MVGFSCFCLIFSKFQIFFLLFFFVVQLTYQLAEVQRLHKTSEATVRQLRTDLALAQKELCKFLRVIFLHFFARVCE